MSTRIVIQAARRSWNKALRRPVHLSFSLLQPMMWMLFFGFSLQRLAAGRIPDGMSYVTYILPGVCAMTVLFGASQAGISLIRDLQTGLLQRMLSTQAPHWALHAGKSLGDVSRLLVQALLVLALGVIVGADLYGVSAALVPAVAALVCFGTAFSSLSCYLALRTGRQESMAAFVHVVNMPVFFTSTALVPHKMLPDWLAGFAQYNPLSMAVNSLRSALLHGTATGWLAQLLPLALLAFIIFGVAVRQYGRAVRIGTWDTR